MVDPISAIGLVGASIGITKELVKAIDLIIGCLKRNTPAATLWHSSLTGLKTQITHAQDQLRLVKNEVEPMRVKQGSGADAANKMRHELGFDKLIQELALQLKASENVFLTATNKFEKQGRFDLALLEALDTSVRALTTPIDSHCQDLKTIRWRVHEARQSIVDAFILNCNDSTGGRFPSLESLGVIRDELANRFLWPDPFCKKFETEDALASGLLLCNKSDLTLKALRKSIQEMGIHWVHAVRTIANRHYEEAYGDREAATHGGQRRVSAVDVLEECRDKILVQLKSVFKAIIEDGTSFTRNDHLIATRGRCTLDEWSSICVAADSGIVVAIGGKMSAGKSSILNAMLGQSILPTASKCQLLFSWRNG